MIKNSEKNHMTCYNLSQKVWAVTIHIYLFLWLWKLFSSANKANVLLLDLSIRKVESITGLGKSTAGRIYQELEMDKENYKVLLLF